MAIPKILIPLLVLCVAIGGLFAFLGAKGSSVFKIDRTSAPAAPSDAPPAETTLDVLAAPIAEVCHPDKIDIYGWNVCKDLCEPSFSCCYKTDESTCDEDASDDVCLGIGKPCSILSKAEEEDEQGVSPLEAACRPKSPDYDMCKELCEVVECCSDNEAGSCKGYANCDNIAEMCASPSNFKFVEVNGIGSLSDALIIRDSCDPESIAVFGRQVCEEVCAEFSCCFEGGEEGCSGAQDCMGIGSPCAILFDDATPVDQGETNTSLEVPEVEDSTNAFEPVTAIVDPSDDLNAICETAGELSSECMSACAPASCCSDPDPSRNCFDALTTQCLKYEICYVKQDLVSQCTPEALETDSGVAACLDRCMPYQCCFDETVDSCFEEGALECHVHIGCKNLVALTKYNSYPEHPFNKAPSRSAAPAVPLDYACSGEHPNGLGPCFEQCKDKFCCFEDDESKSCAGDSSEECDKYEPCRAVAKHPDLSSICSPESVRTSHGQEECLSHCEMGRCCTADWPADDCPPAFCSLYSDCFEIWNLKPTLKTLEE